MFALATAVEERLGLPPTKVGAGRDEADLSRATASA
jgi:hypothetical protein